MARSTISTLLIFERFLSYTAKTAFVFFIIIASFRIFVISISTVAGISMQPALSAGSNLIIEKLTYLFERPSRGDIIQMLNEDSDAVFVKRVIGLPGETIQIYNDRVYLLTDDASRTAVAIDEPYISSHMVTRISSRISNEFTIPRNHYFVLGDNRGNSTDSRVYGPIHRSKIIGRVIWPITQ